MESVVREQIKRGTVQVNLRVDGTSPDDYSLNSAVLEAYRRQIQELQQRWGASGDVPLEACCRCPAW